MKSSLVLLSRSLVSLFVQRSLFGFFVVPLSMLSMFGYTSQTFFSFPRRLVVIELFRDRHDIHLTNSCALAGRIMMN